MRPPCSTTVSQWSTTATKRSVEQELRRAQKELREEASSLAIELAAQILEQQVGEPDRDRLMDEFISRVESGASPGGAR